MNRMILGLVFSLLILTPEIYGVSWPNTAGGGREYPQGLSSDYGPRKSPYQAGELQFHYGLDFPDDNTIRAVEAGEIVRKETDQEFIVVGSNSVQYFHIDIDPSLSVGDIVTEGQIIGTYADNHVDIRFDKTKRVRTNPLRDLFGSLYTSSTPSIESIEVTGDIVTHEGDKYINGQARIDAYIETNTKDLDAVELSISHNPSDSGFPYIYDYHNWKSSDNSLDRVLSYVDKYNPAKDHFYFNFNTSNWPEDYYILNISATDVNGNVDQESYHFKVGELPTKVFTYANREDYGDPSFFCQEAGVFIDLAENNEFLNWIKEYKNRAKIISNFKKAVIQLNVKATVIPGMLHDFATVHFHNHCEEKWNGNTLQFVIDAFYILASLSEKDDIIRDPNGCDLYVFVYTNIVGNETEPSFLHFQVTDIKLLIYFNEDEHGTTSTVRSAVESNTVISVFNANSNVVKTSYEVKKPGESKINVYGFDGKKVLTLKENVDTGLHTSEWRVNQIKSGMYLYQVNLNYNDGDKEKLPIKKIWIKR